MNFDQMVAQPQYSIRAADKDEALLAELTHLGQHHRERSADYARLIDILFPRANGSGRLRDLPYLPVGLFKERLLSSVRESEVFRILQSSGTGGQNPSRIVLDRETARLQTVALSRIMMHILGPRRLPMILIEKPNLIGDRHEFSARVTGLLGMMNFGRDHFYALDGELNLRREGLEDFLRKFGAQPFLIFGFTFLVWDRFYKPLADSGVDLSNGILIHGGGWKKLQEQAVTASEFRDALGSSVGLKRIYNFYGMVEQVGSIFLEGEDGFLYPPNFADVLIRDPYTLEEMPLGEAGVIEVLSVLPRSYPGHCLLTEDVGVIHSIDSMACGRMGKAFTVLGRIPRAELRGCSDVIAAQMS